MKQLSAALLGCMVRIADFSARRTWRRVSAAASRWYAFHSAAARKQLNARPTRRAGSSRKASASAPAQKLVYFDVGDLSADREMRQATRVRNLLADIPIWIDTKNQARVHLWYESKFGSGR